MKNIDIKNRLAESFDSPIRDALWKHIYLSKDFLKICHTKDFQVLNNIKQLGPTYLVYPSAVHTRANHSFGVFEISKKIIFKLLADNRCFNLSFEGVKSFLLAALLHDIGHFPYTHSLKELALEEHEVISGKIVVEDKISSIIKNEIGTDPYWVASIIDQNLESNNREVNFYRNILSGVLDPDKLDYLNRDAFFCGVPYGIQDIDFVIDRMTLNGDKIAVYDDGEINVENILFSKYLMYKSVYWHKSVRAITAMIKKFVIISINEKLIKPEDLYRTGDYDFFQKISNKKFNFLFENINSRIFYKSIYETDDLTNLKKLFDLNYRIEIEKKIAKEFLKDCSLENQMKIIVDIPEPIKFETDLDFINHNGKKIDKKTLFNNSASKLFSKNLRKLHIFVSPDIADKIHIKDIAEWID